MWMYSKTVLHYYWVGAPLSLRLGALIKENVIRYKKKLLIMYVCYNPSKGGLFYSVRAYTCLVQEPSTYVVPELRHEGSYKLCSITGTVHYLKEQGTYYTWDLWQVTVVQVAPPLWKSLTPGPFIVAWEQKKLRMRSVLSESLTPRPKPTVSRKISPAKLDSRICFDVAIYYWDGHRCKRKGGGLPKTTRTPAESSKKFRRRGFKEGSHVFGVFGPSEGPEVVAMSPYVLQRVPSGDYS